MTLVRLKSPSILFRNSPATALVCVWIVVLWLDILCQNKACILFFSQKQIIPDVIINHEKKCDFKGVHSISVSFASGFQSCSQFLADYSSSDSFPQMCLTPAQSSDSVILQNNMMKCGRIRFWVLVCLCVFTQRRSN